MEAATVVKIIDGDTLDVTLAGRTERVRIFGIDTPERGDRCFREATALLASLAGQEVRMLPDIRKVDRNGRLLRYVYQRGGLSIDAEMVAAGAAHAWTRDGALRDPLVALEAAARDSRIGCLWSG
jgi:micrococcal nuclease